MTTTPGDYEMATASNIGQYVLGQVQFREVTDIDLETVANGVVKVNVEPRWLEEEVTEFLSGSDRVPVGVAFVEGRPMTNFNLKHGLTLVTGTTGSGKSSMMMCIGEECHEEGIAVWLLSVEGVSNYLLKKFAPKFQVGNATALADVQNAMNQVDPGEALLIDMLGLLNEPEPGDGVGGRGRRFLEMCRGLHRQAVRDKFYVVASFQAPRPIGGGQGLNIASGLRHAFPILEVHGG
jgi:hypothetical protein